MTTAFWHNLGFHDLQGSEPAGMRSADVLNCFAHRGIQKLDSMEKHMETGPWEYFLPIMEGHMEKHKETGIL